MKSGCLHTFTIHHQHICAHLNKIYKDFVALQLVCLTWSHVKDTVWQVTTVISFHATGMDIRFTREGKEIQKARNRLQLLHAVNPLNHFSSCCMQSFYCVIFNLTGMFCFCFNYNNTVICHCKNCSLKHFTHRHLTFYMCVCVYIYKDIQINFKMSWFSV